MGFYTVVPFLHSRVRRLRSALILLVATWLFAKFAALVVLRVYSHLDPAVTHEFAWMFLPGQLPVFALGFVSYFFWRDRLCTELSSGRKPGKTLAVASGGVLLWTCLQFVLVNRHLPLLASYILSALAHALLLLSLAAYPVPILVNPFVRFIGKISYSIYLTHFAVMYVFMNVIAPHAVRRTGLVAESSVGFGLCYVGILGLTVAVSWITYTFVEAPGMRQATRLSRLLSCWADRRQPRSGART